MKLGGVKMERKDVLVKRSVNVKLGDVRVTVDGVKVNSQGVWYKDVL